MSKKGATTLFQSLPPDLLKEIFKYLTPREIANFTMVCRSNQNQINSPAVDQFWQPQLNILRTMDPAVPMTPPEGTSANTAWRFPVFKRYFEKINQSQLTEITYLQKALELNNPPDISQEMANTLRAIKNAAEKISELEERHKLLNEINEASIRKRIDTDYVELYCEGCHLTRFPSKLLKDPTLKDYWAGLQVLYLSSNQLTAVPPEIGQLVGLEKLGLNHNKLTALPAEIGQLPLKMLYLNNNKFSAVPAEIQKLVALEKLTLEENQLTKIPDYIRDEILHDLKYNTKAEIMATQSSPHAEEKSTDSKRPVL